MYVKIVMLPGLTLFLDFTERYFGKTRSIKNIIVLKNPEIFIRPFCSCLFFRAQQDSKNFSAIYLCIFSGKLYP